MVRLEEMSPSLFSNPLENKPLSTSFSAMGQCNGDRSPSHPSRHTFPSQMGTFPPPLNRDLPSSHVLRIMPKGCTYSTDRGQEKSFKKPGKKMAAWNSDAKEDEKHGNKLQQGEVFKMNPTSPKEERLLRHANRRREFNCLTAAWCHQQPFGKDVAREVRRLNRISREVAVLGWLLAGGELWCRAMLRLLFKVPLPTVVHNLFRMLDEATCGGLQWVETTRQAARRGERCPAWRRVVGALVGVGVAPLAVMWGRWHSRQQRLFLEEAGVLCPPPEDSEQGVLGTTADILLEIMAEMSAALLGRAEMEQDHHLAVAQEPALDTVAEEDEEGCYGDDDPDREGDTISVWDLCWPYDEVVMGRKRKKLSNEEIKLNITNDMDTLHDSNSNKKLTSHRAVSNEYRGATYMEDARRLSTQHRRYYCHEMDEAETSVGGLFPILPPNAPLPFRPHTSSLTLPWLPSVEGSTFPWRGQEPAWETLFHLYCSLFRMMLIIRMLLMTVVRPDRHHDRSDQRSWSSVRPEHARTNDKEDHSPAMELDEHCRGQWDDVQPQHSWEKTHKSDQRRRSICSSSSCDDAWEEETSGIEPTGSSDEGAYRPIKRSVVTGGKKSKSSNSKKVSQETRDFVEPGLSDYEEEMWLQLGITPQESKKEDEEIDIKQTNEDDFEAWLNEESKEKLEDRPDVNYLDESDIPHSRDNVQFENDVRSKANISSHFSTHMSRDFTDFNITAASMSEKVDVTNKLSGHCNIGQGSDEDASTQNSACESKKPSFTRSFTYILRTKSDNLDSYSIPEVSINKSLEYEIKAVKDQTNSKTRTELLNADSGSEIISSDFKCTADVTNRTTQSKTAPRKVIQRGAKIGRPVTRKLQINSNLSSRIIFPQKLQENHLRRTENLLKKSYQVEPIGKLNPPKLKNASAASERNAPSFKVQALGNQSHRPAKTRMNESIMGEQQMSKVNKQKILNKNNSSDSKIQSCIEQQKDHKPWRSCCMNSQNTHKDACCASSKRKNHEKAQ